MKPYKLIFIISIINIYLLTITSLVRAQKAEYTIHKLKQENPTTGKLTGTIIQDSIGRYYCISNNQLFCLDNGNVIQVKCNTNRKYQFLNYYKKKDGSILIFTKKYILKLSQLKSKIEIIEIYKFTNKLNITTKDFTICEDSTGSLWINKQNQIIKYYDNSCATYQIDKHESIRNLIPWIANNNIYATSNKGKTYKYCKTQDKFEPIDLDLNQEIFSYYKMDNKNMFLGTENGLLKLIFNKDKELIATKTIYEEIRPICYAKVSNDKFLIGTMFQGILEANIKNSYQLQNIGGFPHFTANSIFKDSYNLYWVVSNSKVSILERNYFSPNLYTENKEYISYLTTDGEQSIYYSSGNNIYKVSNYVSVRQKWLRNTGKLLTFQINNRYAVVYEDNSQLTIYENKKEISSFCLKKTDFCKIKFIDESKLVVLVEGELHLLDIAKSKLTSINDKLKIDAQFKNFCLLDKNSIIAYSTTNNKYLYKININNHNYSDYIDISDFEIQNIEIKELSTDGTHTYIATNKGCYLANSEKKIAKLDLDEYSDSEILSLKTFNKSLWLAGKEKLLYKNNSYTAIFDLKHGLPCQKITAHNIVTNDSILWVGTTKGVAYSDFTSKIIRSATPVLSFPEKLSINTELKTKNIFEYGNNILVDASCKMYPQELNKFRYKVCSNRQSSEWKYASNKKQILLTGLKPGNYKLNVQAKRQGNYTWSESKLIEFKIKKAWYFRWYSIIVFNSILIGLIALTSFISRKRNRKKNLILQKRIRTKTNQLREINKELNITNQAKDKFLSILAHDLRNPFNAIRSFSKILLEDENLLVKSERTDLIKTIYDTSEETFKLLESLLNWARVQKGMLKTNFKSFDIKPTIDEVVSLSRKISSIKNIEIVEQYTSSKVYADPDLINTILRNLVSNAIKFSYKYQKIIINSQIRNNELIISVKDNGKGMDEIQISKLFKVDTISTTRGTESESGSGFGLILCKEFVELNNGKIWVESRLEKGSIFYFSIPLKHPNYN